MISRVVLTTTGHGDNIAHVTVDLNNPFTGGLQIQHIRATVKAHGITLGTIDSGASFAAKGKTVTTSPSQNIDLNLDPSSIFTVTRDLALEAGLNTQQLDGIVQIGGYQYVSPARLARDIYRGKRNIYSSVSYSMYLRLSALIRLLAASTYHLSLTKHSSSSSRTSP